jgi:hypothetical protein
LILPAALFATISLFGETRRKNKFFAGGAEKGTYALPPIIDPQRALHIFRLHGAPP